MIINKVFGVLFLCFLLTACHSKKLPAQKPPNILFILADDLGAHDLGFSGSTFYETPNLDSLASRSFVFTNGYAASRVCSPSRASIMTGKFTARHGITDWIGARSGEAWRELNRHDKVLPAEYVHELPSSDLSIAEAFQQNGYRTFFAGKWHLGGEGSYPEDHGFEINKGGWDRGSPAGGYFSPWRNPKLENLQEGENLSIRLAKETAQFIRENKDTTFFAFLSFYAVHAPIQTTKEKWFKYQQKAIKSRLAESGYKMERVLPIRTVQDNPVYAGLVETMDDAVGLVLMELRNLGLSENTIVVFTSDNGGVASGDAYSTSNLPLRGGKGYQWEGGIKEPYIISVPWMNPTSQINYPAIGTDFYPTLLDLAGLNLRPEQHLDGLTLKPLLEGKTLPNRPLFWHYPHYGNQGGEPSSIIRDGNWKLIHYWEDGRTELYNLSEDLAEQMDVSKEFPSITEDLDRKLLLWLDDMKAKRPTEDSLYNEVQAKDRQSRIINNWLPRLQLLRSEVLSDSYAPNADWWGSEIYADSLERQD